MHIPGKDMKALFSALDEEIARLMAGDPSWIDYLLAESLGRIVRRTRETLEGEG